MPNIRKRDVVRLRGDISRKGKVIRLTNKATVALVKWDFGKIKRTKVAVELLECVRHKGEPRRRRGVLE